MAERLGVAQELAPLGGRQPENRREELVREWPKDRLAVGRTAGRRAPDGLEQLERRLSRGDRQVVLRTVTGPVTCRSSSIV